MTDASSAAATNTNNNLSDVLGNIGASSTDSGSASGTASATGTASSASATGSSGSVSASKTGSSAAGSQTLTNAPSLGSSSSAPTSASTITGAPALTSGSIAHLTGLPTLSGYYSYPPPSVPPTANAPYMQRTNLPENFVFIIVGAVIAFIAVTIIAWRAMTSWSINRRFRRHEGSATIGSSASYTPLADFKQKQQVPSSHDMKDLGNLPRNFSSVPSLFFSPTAEVARHGGRPVSRDPHQHLPAGHYRDTSRN